MMSAQPPSSAPSSTAYAAAPPPPQELFDVLDPASVLAAFDAQPGSEKLMDFTFLQAISTSKPSPHQQNKKRSLYSLDDDDGDEEDDGTSGDGSDSKDTTMATQPKKQRKPTHVMRKEAKEKLLDEIRHLEMRAALLRQETGYSDRKATEAKFSLTADLREAILQQDLIIANTQSAFSGYTNSRATSPIETYIHLSKDWHQRREALLGMKDRKIRDAHRFLVERTRHMNPFKTSCETSQFESEDGDLCTVRIDVTPFEGVKSMRQVFDALQFYFLNLEITHTEMSGKVTIRENEDDTEKAVLQHRLVTSESAGVLLEKNAVLFLDQSGLDAEHIEDQCAVATGDFVDRDDLYPYCCRQRVRKDATSVVKLSAHRRRRSTQRTPMLQRDSTTCSVDSPDDELVVVLTRWYLIRVRRPEFAIPNDVFQAIWNAQSSSLDVMLKTMKQGVFPTAAAAPWDA